MTRARDRMQSPHAGQEAGPLDILVAIFSDTEAWTIPRARVDDLRRRFPDVRFLHAESVEEMVRLIPTAEVAFTSRLTERAFDAAPALRWVHSPAAGVGSMLFPAMTASRVVISNSRGMNAVAVAEHALTLILAALRRLPEALRAQSERRWIANELSGLPSLRGRTLLVAGLGAIGCELARMASGLGMRVVGTRRETGEPLPDGVAEAHSPSALPALLPRADVVVLAAPLTAETRGMIGAAELALMKPSAWLVNVARGSSSTSGRSSSRWSAERSPARPWTSSSTNPCRRRARCGRCPTSSSRRTSPAFATTTGRRPPSSSPQTSAAIARAKPWRTSSTNGRDTDRTGAQGGRKGVGRPFGR